VNRLSPALRALGFLALGLNSCGRVAMEGTASVPIAPVEAPTPWERSFDSLTADLALRYPFGEWKGIRWDSLARAWKPRIRAAADRGDTVALYTALRGFANSIPDRHVRLRGDAPAGFSTPFAGDLGFTLAELADGRILIATVDSSGPSARAGVQAGFILDSIGNVTAEQAVRAIPHEWLDGGAGSDESRRRDAIRYLSRTRVGAPVSLVLLPPENGARVRRVVVATEDSLAGLSQSSYYVNNADRAAPIEARLLPGNIGYVRLSSFAHPEIEIARAIPIRFAQALRDFIRTGVDGIVVDVRRNSGGLDELAAVLAGHFTTDTAPYFRAVYFDSVSRRFTERVGERVQVVPREPYFGGRVIVLVSSGTVSAGEGFAHAIQRTQQGIALGMYGSNGSYGITGARFLLPGGYRLTFPSGRAEDDAGSILLDADNRGLGGVVPDVRVPRTYPLLMARARGVDVELIWAEAVIRGWKAAEEQPAAHTR
jgi:carboxyl-terminal processing protease